MSRYTYIIDESIKATTVKLLIKCKLNTIYFYGYKLEHKPCLKLKQRFLLKKEDIIFINLLYLKFNFPVKKIQINNF